MCSGPWEVDSLDPTTGAQFSADPEWWGGRVPVEHISLTTFANETSLALAMPAGEIDVDTGVATPRAFDSTAGSGVALLSVPSPAYIVSFTMNTQVAPWNDVHVRRAVAYVLDRANIITAQGGYAVPSYTLIPAQSLLTIASGGPYGVGSGAWPQSQPLEPLLRHDDEPMAPATSSHGPSSRAPAPRRGATVTSLLWAVMVALVARSLYLHRERS
jgi:ABC-type transport system substrate-binding protein